MIIRPAREGDEAAVEAVLDEAFEGDGESRLVAKLHRLGQLTVCLVAESDDDLLGIVVLSPVTHPSLQKGLGLGPVAVRPAFQKQGIGNALIRQAHSIARDSGYEWIVVLGHPDYYPRFGYQIASQWGLENEYGADDAFMALEFSPGILEPGLIKYHEAFSV